jgi:hypothetical protein
MAGNPGVKESMPIFKMQPEMLLGENSTKVKNGSVGSGIVGNYNTIEIMKRVARDRSRSPLIRELTLRVLDGYGIKSQNYLDEARVIGDYVQKKVRYVRDINNVETLHDPLTLIDQIKRNQAHGDCDDMALLIATMLLSIGHQPCFTIVKYHTNANGGFNHIYVTVYEKNYGQKNKTRLVLDAILKRHPIGTEVKYKSKEEISI